MSHLLIHRYLSYCSLVSRMVLKQFNESESITQGVSTQRITPFTLVLVICCVTNHAKLSGLKQQPIVTTHGKVNNLVSNSSPPCVMLGSLSGVQLGTMEGWKAGLIWIPLLLHVLPKYRRSKLPPLLRAGLKLAQYHLCYCLLIEIVIEPSKTW